MPDHIHFIVWLHPQIESHPTLSNVVDAYKSLTAKAILKHLREMQKTPGEKLWQRGYIEHIIRNDFELEQRRLYILNNPIKDALKHNNLPNS